MYVWVTWVTFKSLSDLLTDSISLFSEFYIDEIYQRKLTETESFYYFFVGNLMNCVLKVFLLKSSLFVISQDF